MEHLRYSRDINILPTLFLLLNLLPKVSANTIGQTYAHLDRKPHLSSETIRPNKSVHKVCQI